MEISRNEIDIAINKLNNRKSAGSDEITAESTKANKKWMIPILHYMYDLCTKITQCPKNG